MLNSTRDSQRNMAPAPKVYIVIYTLYHHIYKLALEAQKGLEAAGVEAKIFQVPETLPAEVLEKMHAPPKPDVPIITVDQLKEADGFMFGFGTRFGTMPAQFKAFLDATGQLWASGALAGKFAATFFSTASQHGGQETTALTTVTYFAHHGMIYVPFGFANSHLFDNSEVVGGSAYGAGTVTNGDGSRQPSEKELDIAKTQGQNFGNVVATYVKGASIHASIAFHHTDSSIHPFSMSSELAIVYAALILQDDNVEVTASIPSSIADKLQTLVKAAGIEVEPIWFSLYSKAIAGQDLKELVFNVGAPSAGAAAGPAAAGGEAAAEEAKEEEKKEEAKEESDEDMGFGLFD
ncbi:hypothetical protein VTP01DRAFT_4746 [Rhizomucor pusillus]|uniref:uncharacterized protein n=1 Tax=Rhizomucor pusillus TaxID=4840 RepID=UPI0037440A26